MSKRALVPLNVLAVGAEPIGSHAGDLYYNTVERNVYVFDGSVWIEISNTPASEILDGGNENACSDTVTATLDGGDENAGTDTPTNSYDGGGVI
jgi:hypothetical protein